MVASHKVFGLFVVQRGHNQEYLYDVTYEHIVTIVYKVYKKQKTGVELKERALDAECCFVKKFLLSRVKVHGLVGFGKSEPLLLFSFLERITCEL